MTCGMRCWSCSARCTLARWAVGPPGVEAVSYSSMCSALTDVPNYPGGFRSLMDIDVRFTETMFENRFFVRASFNKSIRIA